MTVGDVADGADMETFILTKFNSLVDVVGEINERIKSLSNSVTEVEQRIRVLEQLQENRHITDDLAVGDKDFTESQLNNSTSLTGTTVTPVGPDADRELPTPWLLSAPLKTSIASLQVLLDLETHNTTEIDALDWYREEDMWYNLLENLPECIDVIPPESATINSLRRVGRATILKIVATRLLLCIHNVPGEGAEKTGFEDLTLTLVAILITAIAEGWARYQVTNRTIGKVFVVLLGENIGRQMRAGSRILTIHELG